MRILFFGDSITDMSRNRDADFAFNSYGYGYSLFVAGELHFNAPQQYEIINRGIGGHRIVDLYARVKKDVWNLKPDVLSILIGVNDVWHELYGENGVDIRRFDKMYRMLIEDTKKVLPNLKIIICEPFVLKESATEEKYEEFLQVKEYAKAVKKIAKDYNLPFLPLQEKFDELAEKYGVQYYLSDGVHPSVAGAKLIANEWLQLFKKME